MTDNNKTGRIGVTSENIFPIIKKFLYSEQDIFLRELVSNAVDASSKLQTIARLEDGIGDISELKITIDINADAKTISITDQGIGMTADEIDRYINQIAFSGAEDFIKKYENSGANNIIGHFGLGFYSAFMVADKVEIDSLSYKKNSEAVHWECDGTPQYTLTPSQRTERGTTITLHLSTDSHKYLQRVEIQTLLDKYCKFTPIPIIFGKKQEWRDGKMQDTDEDNQVNDTHPLWMENPASLKNDDYTSFYHKLYNTHEDPLFYIHLNVDYPFTLKGILFFPKIKETIDPQKNRIHLYSNQVFVTDQVEGVVPEWLYLLEGVIDSPDIPLNVSRSYLQQDHQARKITSHIGKKVADALADLFKNDRKAYEEKWSSIGLFVQYGMLADEKAYERLKPAFLLPTEDGKLYTYNELKALVGAEQTDKDGNLVLLYATNPKEQYVAIQHAKKQNYVVLLMDSPLSLPFMNMLEEKEEKLRFARIDSDTLQNLIQKETTNESSNLSEDSELIEAIFSTTTPNLEGVMLNVKVDNTMTSNSDPLQITSNEWMRRMKEMSRYQGGANFYGELPDSYLLKINPNHSLIEKLVTQAKDNIGEEFEKYSQTIIQNEQERNTLLETIKDKPEEELTEEQKEQRKAITDTIEKAKQARNELVLNFVKKLPSVDYLWDLGLISANLLHGERLQHFLHRSEEILQQL